MPSLLLLLHFLHFPLLSFSRPYPNETIPGQNKLLLTVSPNGTIGDWRSDLVDTDSGSNVSGLSELKLYLHRFGYLQNGATSNFTDVFDEEFKSAISLYQSNLGLRVTGRLDSQTLSQISSPRCGVRDSVDGVVTKYAYFSGRPRWARPSPITLTYALSPTDTLDYISRKDTEAAVRRAFDRWAQVIPIRFSRAEDYEEADVKLGFYSGDHGDGEPFDGVLGVLAHAFSPESGKLHLDAAERWSVDFGGEDSKVAVDLESVVTHEIGHVLGLGHSSVREAVMYPSLSPRTRKADLTVDDVEGVQVLYGSNPNFKMSSLPESDTSSASSSCALVGPVLAMIIVVLIHTIS
ncbi:metalloendoproteinase 1-MMP-like [Iris pallida]|uniref:Metalloendoproteinase 1-MMP-like n=1 Tax=Iris pallida TaxID=29817 RepID=A0AAX6FC19_IRIPA|nr:metalloendoproteinase 1-MMP-like [Iris pallida]